MGNSRDIFEPIIGKGPWNGSSSNGSQDPQTSGGGGGNATKSSPVMGVSRLASFDIIPTNPAFLGIEKDFNSLVEGFTRQEGMLSIYLRVPSGSAVLEKAIHTSIGSQFSFIITHYNHHGSILYEYEAVMETMFDDIFVASQRQLRILTGMEVIWKIR